MTRILRNVSLALFLAACGGSSAGGGDTTTPTPTVAGEGGASAALATQLGINEAYVSAAVTAAQGALGTGTKTPEEKTAAAQVGVDKASAQADAEGKSLTADQKTGLLEGLKGML